MRSRTVWQACLLALLSSASRAADAPKEGFSFGSYGRVVGASDLAGGLASNADFVRWGPRLDEGTYAEFELARWGAIGDAKWKVVSSLGVAGPLFHLDGNFDAKLAVRNLYAEAENVITPRLAAWVGSRMVRGDDVYLLDFWPLDNLNLVGAGARYTTLDDLELALTTGLARPNDPFYTQTVGAVPSTGLGTATVEFLDRPRFVVAARAVWRRPDDDAQGGLKLIGYGEAHGLSQGQRLLENGLVETLPSAAGGVIGAEVGLWRKSGAFANLFLRWAGGLGAYDTFESIIPAQITTPIDPAGASEARVAISAGVQGSDKGALFAAYYRSFADPVAGAFDGSRRTEGALVARPWFMFGAHAGLAVEASWQSLDTNRLDERSLAPVGGDALKLGVMPFLSPGGSGAFTRPHLRLIYAVTIRSDRARLLYPELDVRARSGVEHFLGIGAEWWFDSVGYDAARSTK